MSKDLVTQEDMKLVEQDTSKAEKVLTIKSDNDLEKAAEVLIHLKIEVDLAEEKRKSYVQPAQETIKRINTDFKQITTPRESAIKKLKAVVVAYVSDKMKALKLKEKEVRKEMKDRTLVLGNGASKVVCSLGELRFRRGYDFKVTNKNIVPEKFFVLDTKALEKHIEAEGAANASIPGIKVMIDEISSVAIYKG